MRGPALARKPPSRYARHQLLSGELSNSYYASRANVREKVAVLRNILQGNAPDMPLAVLAKYVTSTPEGQQKFAIILSQRSQTITGHGPV
jgi:hypothetical protein